MTFDPVLQARLTRYVPPDLVAQLPEAQALAQTIRRLNSLHQAVSSFLPRYIADNEKLYAEDYADLRPGTFLFADVSGFTSLSERLQGVGGDEGTEILTRIINDFFAKMLEILAKSNGQLLKFAGDALEAFFPAPRRRDESPLAIRTGLRMQREMVATFQPIIHPLLLQLFGEYDMELTMSIGICQGHLFEAVVGNEVQRDHIIQGGLPGQAMAAEEAGVRDDVIITAGLNDTHSEQFQTEPIGDGFYLVVDNFADELIDYEFVVPRRRRAQTTAIFDFDEEGLLYDVERDPDRLDGVGRFVAREVVDRLAAGGGKMESSNRPATVIFNHFTGFAELLTDWGEEQMPLIVSLLNRYYNLMQRTIANNGGALTRTDPYKTGVKMLITFGAPVAHTDDPERAVTTALEMNRQLAAFNARLQDELPERLRRETYITQRLGITQGIVYAGEVGWQSRREYTVMGDDVNLAARLMAKGEPEQILISQRVWGRVNPHFETEALPLMQMKGKSQPVQAHLVKASLPSVLNMSATSDTPFVGRELQMLSMTYGLQQAKGPRRRQAFAVIGDTGVGKTRMAKQIVQAAEDAGFQVAWANCQLSHIQTQNVWAALLWQLLQLEQAKSEAGQRRLLHVRLNELELQDLEAILSVLLFGSYERIDDHDDEEFVPQIDTPAADPQQPTNVFEMAEAATDLATSGIWGIARDQIEATRETIEHDRPYWAAIEKQISQPDSIIEFLRAYANETPILIVIDDAHRADVPTMNILRRVLDEIRKARLMILINHEPTEALELPIRRKVNVIELEEAETAQMAARFLGVQDIGPYLRQFIWQRTNGRPLFIESLLRLLNDDDHLMVSAQRAELKADAKIDTLPDNVRTLIISQIDHLSPEARALLQVASVLGDGFTAEILIALSDDVNEIHLETLLGEMIYREIIEPLPDDTYRFRHGLTQTTVYESLNRLQRQ
ncbi:MAG: AAA family ATPase, partial [Anaerolineae bacterium]|nr:AAA family ATPase [Anaerolineae bacterium]